MENKKWRFRKDILHQYVCGTSSKTFQDAEDRLNYLEEREEKTKIGDGEKAELIGQIIDAFEDFLELKGITIENDDKTGEEGEAIIYGGDYDELASGIEAILTDAGMLR